MQHLDQLGEAALTRIAQQVRAKMVAKHGVRIFFALAKTPFIEDLVRFTYLAVREELERETFKPPE